MLEARLAGDPALLKIAEMTRMAAERGGELTSRLLAFSRRQTLASKATDVGALVYGMEALLGRALGEQVEPQIQLPSGLWLALVDAPQLESAILNLCINARDASRTAVDPIDWRNSSDQRNARKHAQR